jgi:hypothetical protein
MEASIDLDTLNQPAPRHTVVYSNKRVLIVKKVQESAVVGVVCKSKPAEFNIFQNSPLITRYLNSYGNGGEQRKISIRRNNVLKPILDSDSITYRQLIQESKKASKSRSDAFEKAQDDIMRERSKIQMETSAVLAIENDKAQKILRKATNIKQVAESIVETHQSKRKGTRIGGIV